MQYKRNKPHILDGKFIGDFKKYTQKELDDMRVLELRPFARMHGVPNITHETKKNIIAMLLKIQERDGYLLVYNPWGSLKGKDRRKIADPQEFKMHFDAYMSEKSFMKTKHFDKDGELTHETDRYGFVSRAGFSSYLWQNNVISFPDQWLSDLPEEFKPVWGQCLRLMEDHVSAGVACGDIPAQFGIHVRKSEYNRSEASQPVVIAHKMSEHLTDKERATLEAIVGVRSGENGEKNS